MQRNILVENRKFSFKKRKQKQEQNGESQYFACPSQLPGTNQTGSWDDLDEINKYLINSHKQNYQRINQPPIRPIQTKMRLKRTDFQTSSQKNAGMNKDLDYIVEQIPAFTTNLSNYSNPNNNIGYNYDVPDQMKVSKKNACRPHRNHSNPPRNKSKRIFSRQAFHPIRNNFKQRESANLKVEVVNRKEEKSECMMHLKKGSLQKKLSEYLCHCCTASPELRDFPKEMFLCDRLKGRYKEDSPEPSHETFRSKPTYCACKSSKTLLKDSRALEKDRRSVSVSSSLTNSSYFEYRKASGKYNGKSYEDKRRTSLEDRCIEKCLSKYRKKKNDNSLKKKMTSRENVKEKESFKNILSKSKAKHKNDSRQTLEMTIDPKNKSGKWNNSKEKLIKPMSKTVSPFKYSNKLAKTNYKTKQSSKTHQNNDFKMFKVPKPAEEIHEKKSKVNLFEEMDIVSETHSQQPEDLTNKTSASNKLLETPDKTHKEKGSAITKTIDLVKLKKALRKTTGSDETLKKNKFEQIRKLQSEEEENGAKKTIDAFKEKIIENKNRRSSKDKLKNKSNLHSSKSLNIPMEDDVEDVKDMSIKRLQETASAGNVVPKSSEVSRVSGETKSSNSEVNSESKTNSATKLKSLRNEPRADTTSVGKSIEQLKGIPYEEVESVTELVKLKPESLKKKEFVSKIVVPGNSILSIVLNDEMKGEQNINKKENLTKSEDSRTEKIDNKKTVKEQNYSIEIDVRDIKKSNENITSLYPYNTPKASPNLGDPPSEPKSLADFILREPIKKNNPPINKQNNNYTRDAFANIFKRRLRNSSKINKKGDANNNGVLVNPKGTQRGVEYDNSAKYFSRINSILLPTFQKVKDTFQNMLPRFNVISSIEVSKKNKGFKAGLPMKKPPSDFELLDCYEGVIPFGNYSEETAPQPNYSRGMKKDKVEILRAVANYFKNETIDEIETDCCKNKHRLQQVIAEYLSRSRISELPKAHSKYNMAKKCSSVEANESTTDAYWVHLQVGPNVCSARENASKGVAKLAPRVEECKVEKHIQKEAKKITYKPNQKSFLCKKNREVEDKLRDEVRRKAGVIEGLESSFSLQYKLGMYSETKPMNILANKNKPKNVKTITAVKNPSKTNKRPSGITKKSSKVSFRDENDAELKVNELNQEKRFKEEFSKNLKNEPNKMVQKKPSSSIPMDLTHVQNSSSVKLRIPKTENLSTESSDKNLRTSSNYIFSSEKKNSISPEDSFSLSQWQSNLDASLKTNFSGPSETSSFSLNTYLTSRTYK